MTKRNISTISWILSYLRSKPDDDFAEQSRDAVVSAFKKAAARAKNRRHRRFVRRLSRHQKQHESETVHDSHEKTSPSTGPINILCIDGGGAKGWTMMPMYEALEESFGSNNQGEPLSNVFDLVAGTSAGGIGAMMLHRYPKYGDATTMGRALLRPVLDESFGSQGMRKFLRTGNYCRDSRGSIYRKFFGSDTQLGRPSSIPDDNDVTAAYNMNMEEGLEEEAEEEDSLEQEEEQSVGPKTFVVATQKKIKEPSNSSLRSLLLKSSSFSSFKMTRSTSNLTRSSSNLNKSTTSKMTKAKSAMNLNRSASTKTFNRLSSSMSSSTNTSTTTRGRGPPLEACLLRTYDKPNGHSGLEPVPGTSSIKMWEALEATSAVPGIWGRTHARRQSFQEADMLRLADGGLVANNPTRHALQEAAMLFPGRPLGLVLSIGLGRHAKDKPDQQCEDLAEQVKQAGGQYVRLDPIVDDAMGPLTNDRMTLKKVEYEVFRYMETSEEAQRAKELIDQCVEQNPAIRGRYAPASEDQQSQVVVPKRQKKMNKTKDGRKNRAKMLKKTISFRLRRKQQTMTSI